MRKITMTLEFELDELSDEERKAGDYGDGLPSVDDIDPVELGGMVADWMKDANVDSGFWGGSDLYAQIVNVRLIEAGIPPS